MSSLSILQYCPAVLPCSGDDDDDDDDGDDDDDDDHDNDNDDDDDDDDDNNNIDNDDTYNFMVEHRSIVKQILIHIRVL